MSIINKDLKKRILQISYKYNLSHLSSCLTAVDIIDEIYSIKRPDEKFVLSSGHAGLALYTVIEKYEGKNAEHIWKDHGTHPDRCDKCTIACSSGSLGHGLSIALGMALADRTKNVYCLISDGECAEGSIYEALRIKDEYYVENLIIYLNNNGYSAYKETNSNYLPYEYAIVCETNIDDFPFLKGIEGHYHKMTEDEYKQAMEVLK